jgi:hypothetical protein
MHDGGKIVAGIVVFLALALTPFWSNAITGTGPRPEPKIVTKERACVAPVEEMRASHMELLNEWRDKVVREGVRTTTLPSGKTVRMSLTGTCMECHPNKKDFCDSCHTYMAVSPYCWECHVEPKERS